MPRSPQGTSPDVSPTTPLPPVPGRTVSLPWALFRGCRARQWMKNLLVLTAPALGGHLLTDATVLPGTLVALATFCAASAAVYLANDVHDVDVDRCHPVKRFRPVASGDLPVPLALTAATLLAAGSLAVALWWAPALAAVLAAYLALQVAYTFSFKHVPGLDLATVATGFVLRVVAGGVAAPVALSLPFLVVVGFAALFMIAGKRYSEMRAFGAGAGTRRSLARYSQRWLLVAWVGAAAVAVVGYGLAAAGAPTGTAAAAWSLASVPAFVAGVARYAGHVRRGEAERPEALLLDDRVLQALGIIWLVPLLVSVVLP